MGAAHVSMLIFQSATPRPIWETSPWFDVRIQAPIEATLEKAEAQTHRRFLKTHLPFDALPVYDGVKFIHVARDGRDAAMSLHNHLLNFTAGGMRRINEVSIADEKFGDHHPHIQESAAEFSLIG